MADEVTTSSNPFVREMQRFFNEKTQRLVIETLLGFAVYECAIIDDKWVCDRQGMVKTPEEVEAWLSGTQWSEIPNFYSVHDEEPF